MPLLDQLPVIDDRRFADLVDEARARIPRYTREWTDLNDSDPGITLVQLFAWLGELLLFRLGEVPELNYIKFLELIGIELEPARPAGTYLTLPVVPGTPAPYVEVPARTQSASPDSDPAGPVIFETTRRLLAFDATLEVRALVSGIVQSLTARNDPMGEPWHPLGEAGDPGNALLLGLDLAQAFPPLVELALTFYSAADAASGAVTCGGGQGGCRDCLAWEYHVGTDWRRLAVLKDETAALARTGQVLLKTPAKGLWQRVPLGGAGDPPRFWLRARVLRKGWLQSINLHLLRSGHQPQAGVALELPAEVRGITIGASGERLYLPYAGGVIVVEVDETDCCGLLEGGDCPGCEESDCLTLATVEDWRPGARLIDKADSIETPADGTAWIDNALGRIVLPSTQAIAAALKCLCAHGAKGGGEQGPPGKDGQDGLPGADGQGIDQVDLQLVDCDQPAGAQLTGTSPNRRLILTLPSCCTPKRTRICDISWEHGADVTVDELFGLLLDRGLIVAFDDLVRNIDINLATFRVLVSILDRDTGGLRWVQPRPAAKPPGEAGPPDTMPVGVELDARCDTGSAGRPIWDRNADVPAMIYRMTSDQEVPQRMRQQLEQAAREQLAYLRVEVAGDLIRDINDQPIDANHLPPWVRAAGVGGPLALTGDCVRGGLFESWLRIVRH